MGQLILQVWITFFRLPNTIVCIPNLFVDYKLFIEIQKLTKKPMIILEPKKLYSKIMTKFMMNIK